MGLLFKYKKHKNRHNPKIFTKFLHLRKFTLRVKSDILLISKTKENIVMKKLIAIFIALMMILSLAACSEQPEDELIEVVPARGTTEEGFYKNEAFGISFDVPAEWYFLTDEEIAQTMGSTAEQLFGEDVLEQADYIYDLYCVDMESGTTVSINYENLGTIGEFTEESEYLETVLAQLLSGTNPGITATELSVAKVGKTTVPCLNITLEAGGNTIYESIIVKKIGTWIGTVTMATLEEAELETLAASISFE